MRPLLYSLPTALFALSLVTVARGQDSPPPSTALPVRSVSLFTSGVSYVERDGQVSGEAVVPLTFRTTQINDILKSMVLIDQHGQVQPVTYGAHDPISRTLQSFAVDVTQPTSKAELLNHLRGSSVSVTTTASQPLTGQIVGVEDRTVTENGKTYTVQVLNLLTQAGLQSVFLDDARAIKLLDPRIDSEFRDALTTLAGGSDDQRRTVTLHFSGSGRRAVSVGYVTESPLWKISYRLLLGGAKGQTGQKPYLQGWALVENTTDDDWQGIHLSLVSGRPVSFIQDLYTPLYLPRPVVAPDIIASPEPQTHEADLLPSDTLAAPPVTASPPAPMGISAGAATRAALPDGVDRIYAKQGDNSLLLEQQVRQSVTAQAQGADAGEQYAYDITTPVTLPRQQAAMIPVVAQDIDGEKVLLYNADSDPKFPLDAVRLHNTTPLHLKGGPVTLFDDGVYAGDARMEDVPPGATRLISYAVDLSVLGDRKQTSPSSRETSLSIKRGVLIVTRREKQETDYLFKSQAKEAKTVLVEQPFDPQFTLVAPAKADEQTANLYRFAVPIKPGETQTLKVIVSRPISTTIGLIDADLDVIGVYANRTDLSAETRTALQGVVQRRRAIDDLQSQAAERDAEISSLGGAQDRIRKNMAQLDHASTLYKRYVAELDSQETRLQNLQSESQALKAKAADADRALRSYLDGLTL
jgi:hypothetical protein